MRQMRRRVLSSLTDRLKQPAIPMTTTIACRQLLGALTALAQRRRPRPGLLLACNKSDQGAKAFDEAFILKQLEKEMCVSHVDSKVPKLLWPSSDPSAPGV